MVKKERDMDEDRIRRRELLEQKRLIRKQQLQAQQLQQQQNDVEQEKKKNNNNEKNNTIITNVDTTTTNTNTTTTSNNTNCIILTLPDDAIYNIYSMLNAIELGCITLSCTYMNHLLYSSRIYYLLSRLSSLYYYNHNNHHNAKMITNNNSGLLLKRNWYHTENDIKYLLNQSLISGGNTGRCIVKPQINSNTKKTKTNNTNSNNKSNENDNNIPCNEFISYARYIEESICGYCILNNHNDNNIISLPYHIQGRFVSCSPEHTICRIGGDNSTIGAGGSGIASWGIGKRGQLGHGTRDDISHPKRLLYSGHNNNINNDNGNTKQQHNNATNIILYKPFGYNKIRIVQVSAGGGLVRIAHTLLLTNYGKVLSFGVGQYGALGHGYSPGKQLPDIIQPKYIHALQHVICTCISAGELHSAAVTSDGDIYTWGDGFCGQLGHGDKRPQLIPKLIETSTKLKNSIDRPIDDEIIMNVSCGCRHTIAITNDGEVYTWGLGYYGVLGRSYTSFDYDHPNYHNTDSDDDDDEDNNDNNVHGQNEQSRPGANDHAATAAHSNNIEIIDTAAIELAAQLDLIANVSLDDSSDQCIPKIIDSLIGIHIIGSCAGHRHTLFLDNNGYLYSCGSGKSGCLGHDDTLNQIYPCRIEYFINNNIRIHQMSAGVDISMAVSTSGDVYSWGKMHDGRIGLGMSHHYITIPRHLAYLTQQQQSSDSTTSSDNNNFNSIKAVDVECGYVHSIIVAIDGTIHICGGVGVNGDEDGQLQQTDHHYDVTDNNHIHNDNDQVDHSSSSNNINSSSSSGRATIIPDINIWHRLEEPTNLPKKKEKWQKLGKYEVKGRSKNL